VNPIGEYDRLDALRRARSSGVISLRCLLTLR
jgi:hypothetical protein